MTLRIVGLGALIVFFVGVVVLSRGAPPGVTTTGPAPAGAARPSTTDGVESTVGLDPGEVPATDTVGVEVVPAVEAPRKALHFLNVDADEPATLVERRREAELLRREQEEMGLVEEAGE